MRAGCVFTGDAVHSLRPLGPAVALVTAAAGLPSVVVAAGYLDILQPAVVVVLELAAFHVAMNGLLLVHVKDLPRYFAVYRSASLHTRRRPMRGIFFMLSNIFKSVLQIAAGCSRQCAGGLAMRAEMAAPPPDDCSLDWRSAPRAGLAPATVYAAKSFAMVLLSVPSRFVEGDGLR